ncbi:MAG TPA: D-alanyl-D-alanine carboxypeptidase [Syntrophaceticus sp.]|nr:D-alanyl-D-alanine carboxypeptidase [Syntrophaceticus sp.]
MREHRCFLLLTVFLSVLLLTNHLRFGTAWADEQINLTANAAVLMDYSTGAVLYSYNATKPLPPASTTKIMTGLLSLELGDGEERVVIDEYSAMMEGTSLYLKAGQILTLEDLTKGALINSGNDAASAIAVHMAGSEQLFGDLMTFKARTIGCSSRSRFYNPHGLPQEGHAISAYDLAVITRYAMQNKDFRRIVGTKSGSVRDLSEGEVFPLYNTNRLLGYKKNGLEIIGVKTGTTDEAGECLVAAAKYKGSLLISVVLGSSARYEDTLKLFEYACNNCCCIDLKKGTPIFQIPVWRGSASSLAVGPCSDISLMISPRQMPQLERRVYLKPYVKAPCSKGDRVGKMEIMLGNQLLYSVELMALEDVKRVFWWN